MNLIHYRDSYYEFTDKASNVARQLAFAGIAFIWIFRNETVGPIAIPKQLVLPAMLLVGGLAADLLHYVVASLVWGIFHRCKEKEHGVGYKGTIEAPPWFNWPGISLWAIKIVLVTLSYIFIFVYVLSQYRTM